MLSRREGKVFTGCTLVGSAKYGELPQSVDATPLRVFENDEEDDEDDDDGNGDDGTSCGGALRGS